MLNKNKRLKFDIKKIPQSDCFKESHRLFVFGSNKNF
jgi:hypothetical protein